MWSAYSNRSVLKIFHKSICFAVVYSAKAHPNQRAVAKLWLEKKHWIKFYFLVDRQKEQQATMRLILSSPSCTSFQCDIETSIYHQK